MTRTPIFNVEVTIHTLPIRAHTPRTTFWLAHSWLGLEDVRRRVQNAGEEGFRTWTKAREGEGIGPRMRWIMGLHCMYVPTSTTMYHLCTAWMGMLVCLMSCPLIRARRLSSMRALLASTNSTLLICSTQVVHYFLVGEWSLAWGLVVSSGVDSRCLHPAATG